MSCSNCDIYGICQGGCFTADSNYRDLEDFLEARFESLTKSKKYLLEVLAKHKKVYMNSQEGLTYERRRTLNKLRDAIDKVNADLKLLSENKEFSDPQPSNTGRLVALVDGSRF